MNSLRSSVGFIVGYGSRQSYIDFACGGVDPGAGLECDGPPEKGLVGKMAEILNQIPPALEAAGIASCEDVPTSGSSTISLGGESVTLTYEPGTQSIPSSWDSGGTAFSNRLEFAYSIATVTTNFAAEFACGTDGILMSINMPVGPHAPGYTRPINVWVGTLGGHRVADVYVSEVNGSSQVRGAYAFHLDVNESAKTYQLAGSSSTWFGSTSGVDRVHIHGNYETNVASVYLSRVVKNRIAGGGGGGGGNDYLDHGGLAALSGGNSAAVGTSTNFALTSAGATADGTSVDFQGCVDFDSPAVAPSSAALCSGLTLSNPPAPVIAPSTGNFGAGWTVGTMHTALVGLPDLSS